MHTPLPLTETMQQVLRLAAAGRDLYEGCPAETDSSMQDKRSMAITSLRRRGLLYGDRLSDSGWEAVLENRPA